MITIYSAKRTTYQPYNIPTRDIEDSSERQFTVNLIRWFVSEVLGLLKAPIKLIAFLCDTCNGVAGSLNKSLI